MVALAYRSLAHRRHPSRLTHTRMVDEVKDDHSVRVAIAAGVLIIVVGALSKLIGYIIS